MCPNARTSEINSKLKAIDISILEPSRNLCSDLIKTYSLEEMLSSQTSDKMGNDSTDLTIKLCYIIQHCSDDIVKPWILSSHISSINIWIDRCVKCCLVPHYSGREDIGYNESDFFGVTLRASICMGAMKRIIVFLQTQQSYNEDICTLGLMIALEHQDCQDLWTNQQCVLIADDLIQLIIQWSSYDCLTTALIEKYFHKLHCHFKEKLTVSCWKEYPAVCRLFTTCLYLLKSPHLSDILLVILPPVLLFVDDHQLDYKIMGVKCLHHIITNTSRSELKWYNHIGVIYEAVKRLFYTHDKALLDVVLPCMLKILYNLQDLRCDKEIMSLLLNNMQLENNLAPRRVYMEYLGLFIDYLGIKSLHYVKKIEQIIEVYLEVYDGKQEISRINALIALQHLIRCIWPRLNFQKIMKYVIPVFYDTVTGKNVITNKAKTQILKECDNIVLLLYKINSSKIKMIVQKLNEQKLNKQCEDMFKTWLTIPRT